MIKKQALLFNPINFYKLNKIANLYQLTFERFYRKVADTGCAGA